MDEVGLLVVHDFKLMFQPQEKLHALLEQGDWVVALLLSTLWGLIAFRGHEFIEHDVVLLELLVQPLIVGFLADVNDGDQIDFDTFLTTCRDVLGDRGLQRDGLPVFVPLNADEAGFGIIGACSRECWYEACQYQQRLEDETHSLPPLNGPADSQHRLRRDLRRSLNHSAISAISSSRGRVLDQWISSSHMLGSAFLPNLSRYILSACGDAPPTTYLPVTRLLATTEPMGKRSRRYSA